MREEFPLFCTAQVIDDLLRKSEAGYGNVWTLVKTADQKTFEKPTEPPVSPFTTTFESATLDDLGTFCKTHSPDNLTEFAILDQRSMDDSTVVLVKWEFWTEYIDPDDGGDADSNPKQCEGWQTLRVRFEKAADVMSGLEYLPVQEFNSNPGVMDGEGVYRG